jgi:hypothetical protein
VSGVWRGGIRGDYYVPGFIGGGNYTVPDFCDLCGAPFPWASRQARLWQLENLLDDQDVSDADRLEIHEQVEALRAGDLPESEQAERWQRIKRLSPSLIGSGQKIVVSAVTAAIQKSSGSRSPLAIRTYVRLGFRPVADLPIPALVERETFCTVLSLRSPATTANPVNDGWSDRHPFAGHWC